MAVAELPHIPVDEPARPLQEGEVQRGELLASLLTLARLGQAATLHKKIMNDEPFTGTLAGIIAVDAADGMIARGLGVDTKLRRATDGIVDRITIVTALSAAARKVPEARPYIGLLAAKEVFASVGNIYHHHKTGEVTNGKGLHKLGSISVALFAVAVGSGNKKAITATGLMASAINVGLAADYANSWLDPSVGERNKGVRYITGTSLFSRR